MEGFEGKKYRGKGRENSFFPRYRGSSRCPIDLYTRFVGVFRLALVYVSREREKIKKYKKQTTRRHAVRSDREKVSSRRLRRVLTILCCKIIHRGCKFRFYERTRNRGGKYVQNTDSEWRITRYFLFLDRRISTFACIFQPIDFLPLSSKNRNCSTIQFGKSKNAVTTNTSCNVRSRVTLHSSTFKRKKVKYLTRGTDTQRASMNRYLCNCKYFLLPSNFDSPKSNLIRTNSPSTIFRPFYTENSRKTIQEITLDKYWGFTKTSNPLRSVYSLRTSLSRNWFPNVAKQSKK